MERSFIESVLTGQPERFESYIEGLWSKAGSPEDEPTLVYFAPDSRRISIYSQTEKQTWNWDRSNPSYTGIYAAIVNSGVPDMVRIPASIFWERTASDFTQHQARLRDSQSARTGTGHIRESREEGKNCQDP